MRLVLIALAVVLAFFPVHASGGGSAEGEATTEGANTTVELPMLVAPVTVNERLYHYAYMRVMLEAKDVETRDIAQAKVPYIIDAMLREMHRESIALNGDPQQIDGDGLMKRLLSVANAIVGAGSFTSMKFRDTIQTDDPELNAAAAAAAPPPEPETPKPQTASEH